MSNRDFPDQPAQFCTNCGNPLQAGMEFCPSCGKGVGEPASSAQLDFAPVDHATAQPAQPAQPAAYPPQHLAHEMPVGVVSTVQGTMGAEIYALKSGHYIQGDNLYKGKFSITTQGFKFLSKKVESFVLLFQAIQNATVGYNSKILDVQMTNGQVFQFKVPNASAFVKVIMQYKWTFDKKSRA